MDLATLYYMTLFTALGPVVFGPLPDKKYSVKFTVKMAASL